MTFDFTNFISGLAGGVIGASASLLTAYLQHRWTRAENEKQREHERSLHEAQVRHDKNMQNREQNIRKTGIASMAEIGGG